MTVYQDTIPFQCKMNYKCYLCRALFDETKLILTHLRKEHKIVENSDQIKCLVNFGNSNHCKRTYHTFSGLKTHMKTCLENRKPDEVNRFFSSFIERRLIGNYYIPNLIQNSFLKIS